MKLNVDFSELHYSASKMIAGTVVTIYQMPLTQEQPEGEAKLVEFVGLDPDTQLQTWVVQFLSDQQRVQRKILIEVEA